MLKRTFESVSHRVHQGDTMLGTRGLRKILRNIRLISKQQRRLGLRKIVRKLHIPTVTTGTEYTVGCMGFMMQTWPIFKHKNLVDYPKTILNCTFMLNF